MRFRISARRFTQDLWAPLSHIPVMGPDAATMKALDLPTWVDETDWRRLTAYRVLTSYRTNSRRMFLPDSEWQRPVSPAEVPPLLGESGKAPAEEFREYGHGNLLVEAARSVVLGEDQTVVIPDLKDADPEDPALAGDREALDWLTDWARTERLRAKLQVQETSSIGDGDGILVEAWSRELGRPILRNYDSGFYFPDLLALDTMPGWSQEYPPIVHLAWEYTRPDGVVMLRRNSWTMVKLETPVAAPWGGQRTWTCLFESAEWQIDRFKTKVSIYTLSSSQFGGKVLIDEDLLVDFIPVIHIPNTETGEHFGAATPMIVAQLLDDLSGSDTDLANTASTSAAPPAVFTGAGDAQPIPAGPGVGWWGEAGASMGFADTSKVLDAGLKFKHNLLDDLGINTRLGVALLGRVTPKDVPSGFALQLGFASAQSMLREMRLVRGQKHPLILKFAYRLAQARGALDAGPTPDAVIDLGAGLPTDAAVVIEQVSTLLTAHAISTGTAVRMLQAAGLPIEDAEAEVAAIQSEDPAAAVQVVEATGDVQAGRDRLGLGQPTAPVPPEPAPDQNQ